jgi:nucleotide-binding universal stress UspA family protein
MSSPIIVGLALRSDDSAPLALARRLARLTDSPLALVATCPREVPTPVPTPQYALALREDAQTRLDAVARTLADKVEVSSYVQFGSPAGVMHDLAEQLSAAAIVVGSTHRGPVGRLLMGDVAAGLLHGSPCPVAVAPRGYDATPGTDLARIGVAFDGTPESEEALASALGIAERMGGYVTCFTVLEPTDWTGGSPVPGWVPSPAAEESRIEHAQSSAPPAVDEVAEAPSPKRSPGCRTSWTCSFADRGPTARCAASSPVASRAHSLTRRPARCWSCRDSSRRPPPPCGAGAAPPRSHDPGDSDERRSTHRA